jgi:hypothetical protein
MKKELFGFLCVRPIVAWSAEPYKMFHIKVSLKLGLDIWASQSKHRGLKCSSDDDNDGYDGNIRIIIVIILKFFRNPVLAQYISGCFTIYEM